MKFALKPILIGIAAGFVVGLTLFCLVAWQAFGTYESASVSRALFPYALAADANDSAWVILSLWFLQYPLYGALLGIVCNRERRRILILVAVLALIVGGHLVAVRAAQRAYVIWVDSQSWE